MRVLSGVVIVGAILTGAVFTTLRQLGPGAFGTWESLHIVIGVCAIVAAILSAALTRTGVAVRARRLLWLAVVLVGVAAAIGWGAYGRGAFVHACVAPLGLAALTAASVVAAGERRRGEAAARTCVRPTTWWFARVGPIAVAGQIVLGASYRHELLGVLPHMAGAAVVLILMLSASTKILQLPTPPRPARIAAVIAMAVVVTQLALGIATFVTQLLGFTQGGSWLVLTGLHVSVGALTLAAAVVLSVTVSDSLQPDRSAGASEGS